MSRIKSLVEQMLDGRENDEQITVEVSLLWSLIQDNEAYEDIRPYAKHLDECKFTLFLKTGAASRADDWARCDCGFDEVLDKYEDK